MKAFNQFFEENNNKYVEVVDPSSLNQCFDLVVKWSDELGIPRVFPFNYAYQIYTSFGVEQAKYFDRIVNSASNSPKEGDIMVFSNNYNWAGGHTGIATGKGSAQGNANDWFEMFSQNDPFRSNCHLVIYNYNYVLGWLHPKNYSSTLTPEQKITQVITILNTDGIQDTLRVQKIRTVLGV